MPDSFDIEKVEGLRDLLIRVNDGKECNPDTVRLAPAGMLQVHGLTDPTVQAEICEFMQSYFRKEMGFEVLEAAGLITQTPPEEVDHVS